MDFKFRYNWDYTSVYKLGKVIDTGRNCVVRKFIHRKTGEEYAGKMYLTARLNMNDWG